MKRTILMSMAALALASIVVAEAYTFFSKPATASDDQSSSGGWEYLVVQGGTVNLSGSDGGSMRKEPGPFSREAYPLERNMDKLGAKGWELVTVTGSPADPVFFFKRRK